MQEEARVQYLTDEGEMPGRSSKGDVNEVLESEENSLEWRITIESHHPGNNSLT